VLGVELPWLEGLTRANRPQRLPVVLTPAEVRAVLERIDGVYGLMARLLYGTGMRLMECVRLRVKDVDFGRNEILVRDGKGTKDRVMMLPAALAAPLRDHLARRRVIYEDDLRDGRAAEVSSPARREEPHGRDL
jgi:integrase